MTHYLNKYQNTKKLMVICAILHLIILLAIPACVRTSDSPNHVGEKSDEGAPPFNTAYALPDNSDDATLVAIDYLNALRDNNISVLKDEILYFPNMYDRQGLDGTEAEFDAGIIELTIEKCEISESESKRMSDRYAGSELADTYNWSLEFCRENLVAVIVKYIVKYDNTRVSADGGNITQYMYMARNTRTANWQYWQSSFDIQESDRDQ
jgi:hypothetical protein